MQNKEGLVLLLIVAQITAANCGDALCTNTTVVEPIANTCLTTNFLVFAAASGDSAKCAVLTGTIVPCIINSVESTYSVTCTEADEYTLINTFKNTISTALSFDVDKCLPDLTCTNYSSVEYYTHRICELEFTSYQSSSSCSDYCEVATCYSSASSCTVDVYDSTVQENLNSWLTFTSASQAVICCAGNNNDKSKTALIVGVTVGVAVLLIGAAVAAVILYKKFGISRAVKPNSRITKFKLFNKSDDNQDPGVCQIKTVDGGPTDNKLPLFTFMSTNKVVNPP